MFVKFYELIFYYIANELTKSFFLCPTAMFVLFLVGYMATSTLSLSI